MKTKIEQQNPELMSKDPQNWKGPLYFNSNDSRIIVPKLTPFFGWTFNFAKPMTYVIIVAFITAIIIFAIIVK